MDFELIDRKMREGLSAPGYQRYQNKTAALFHSLYGKLDAARQDELCELLLSLCSQKDQAAGQCAAGIQSPREAFQGTMATLA